MLHILQNGSVESVLHSPGDSSDGSNNPVGRDSTPDTAATIVDSSHYITVAGKYCHKIHSHIFNRKNLTCVLIEIT